MATKAEFTHDIPPEVDMFALVLHDLPCEVEIRFHTRPCVLVHVTCEEELPEELREELLFVGGGLSDGLFWVYVLPGHLQPGYTITLGNSVRHIKEPFKCKITKVVIYTPAPCSICSRNVAVTDPDEITFHGPPPTVFTW